MPQQPSKPQAYPFVLHFAHVLALTHPCTHTCRPPPLPDIPDSSMQQAAAAREADKSWGRLGPAETPRCSQTGREVPCRHTAQGMRAAWLWLGGWVGVGSGTRTIRLWGSLWGLRQQGCWAAGPACTALFVREVRGLARTHTPGSTGVGMRTYVHTHTWTHAHARTGREGVVFLGAAPPLLAPVLQPLPISGRPVSNNPPQTGVCAWRRVHPLPHRLPLLRLATRCPSSLWTHSWPKCWWPLPSSGAEPRAHAVRGWGGCRATRGPNVQWAWQQLQQQQGLAPQRLARARPLGCGPACRLCAPPSGCKHAGAACPRGAPGTAVLPARGLQANSPYALLCDPPCAMQATDLGAGPCCAVTGQAWEG